jgi:hypothetical protein
MRKRLRLFALIAGIVALVAFAWLLGSRTPTTAITPANAAKIRNGMTVGEVEAVLGGPARDECTGPIVYDASVGRVSHSLPENGLINIWQSDTVQLSVVFRDGVVVYHSPLPVHRVDVDASVFDRLRGWLGL